MPYTCMCVFVRRENDNKRIIREQESERVKYCESERVEEKCCKSLHEV